KPFIDGTLARVAQAVTAVGLLALAAVGAAKIHALAIVVALLAGAWLGVAVTTRGSYLATLRRLVSGGKLGAGDSGRGPAEAGLLVEKLASPEPTEVIAALRVLARRRRGRLIPALILYHPERDVLVEALSMFASSSRTDWPPLAVPLLRHEDEIVRNAAVRAIARQGMTSAIAELTRDASPRLRAYAALNVALREAPDAPGGHPALIDALA